MISHQITETSSLSEFIIYLILQSRSLNKFASIAFIFSNSFSYWNIIMVEQKKCKVDSLSALQIRLGLKQFSKL